MKKVKVIGIALFMMALIAPSLVWGGFMALDFCGLNIMDELDADTGEKREDSTLSEEMTYVSLGANIEEYYNDRIPFRSTIINADKKLTGLVERPYNSYIENKYQASTEDTNETIGAEEPEPVNQTADAGTTSFWDNYGQSEEPIDEVSTPDSVGGNADVDDEDKTDDQTAAEGEGDTDENTEDNNEEEITEEEYVETAETTSDIPLRIVNDKVILGAENWLFYGESKSIENFRGTNLKSEEELVNFAQPFIALKTFCELRDRQFIAFVCPDKEKIYTEYYPNVDKVSEISLTEQVQSYITSNSSVKFIYPKSELRKYKKSYQLYYKHDSHWNAAGGFIGTREILLSLGIPTQTIDEVYSAPVTISSGDLILLGGLSQDEYPEDTNYDIGYMNHVGVFCDDPFNSDKRRIEITSQSENYSHLVLVGDSCKMNMLPYLAVNFDRVTFIHKNAISDESSKAAFLDADVIVLEIAERNINEFSTVAWKVYEAVESNNEN